MGTRRPRHARAGTPGPAARTPETVPALPRTAARLSIGALARATGIPVETLRTWELRYGFPAAGRRPSGHRVYAPPIVPRLRRIADALARGHRAGDVVPASDRQLDELLQSGEPVVARPQVETALDTTVDDFLRAVSAFDADRLTRMLLSEWARLDPLEFIERRLAPLITAAGDAWSAGRLQISHEHFLSERVGDLLRTLRLPFEDRASGPHVVFATLPGESHALGLQMAALVAARAGTRVIYLGTDVPVGEIASLATARQARVVAISVSAANRGDVMTGRVADLRRRLPPHIGLVVGGRGAVRNRRRIEIVEDFRQFDTRMRSLGGGSASN